MSSLEPPFDDTVQLEAMDAVDYFSDSDTAPIVPTDGKNVQDTAKSNSEDQRMDERGAPVHGRKAAYVTIATLLLINLLNYMDRFTIAGTI
ncbi:hypothetical protein BaRGS_00020550 [Batillaria attramentaria]|uniref:Major facilitator superfamily (MFS) profile domain-containing protein n=1 Tax=Batillaria attramentaria TaxID=370345 RepID=A0ABD0KLU6_9CAEN